jgi:hypothetical protein
MGDYQDTEAAFNHAPRQLCREMAGSLQNTARTIPREFS